MRRMLLLMAAAVSAALLACSDSTFGRRGDDAPTPATLFAFDSTTGGAAWETEIPIAAVSAVAERGDVVFAVGYNECPAGKAEFVALDRDTGSVLWTGSTVASECFDRYPDPIAASAEIAAICERRTLVGRAARTGDELWRTGGQCTPGSPPFLHEELVLTSGSVIDINSGEVLWRTGIEYGEVALGVTEGVVLYLSREYEAGSPDVMGTIIARDLLNGTELWQTEMGAWPEQPSKLLLGDGAAAFVRRTRDGTGTARELVVLDAATGGEIVSRHYADGTARLKAIAHGRVYVEVDLGGEAIDMESGQITEVSGLGLLQHALAPSFPAVDAPIFTTGEETFVLTELGPRGGQAIDFAEHDIVGASISGLGRAHIYATLGGHVKQIHY